MNEQAQHIYKKHVFVCISGKTCPLQGGQAVFDELRKQTTERGLKGQIRVNKSGCLDQCGNGPMVVVYPDGIWYAGVSPQDCEEIVVSHLLADKPVERLLYDGRGKVTQ